MPLAGSNAGWGRPVGIEEAREKRRKVVRGTWAATHRRVRCPRTSPLRILGWPFRVGFRYSLRSGVGPGAVIRGHKLTGRKLPFAKGTRKGTMAWGVMRLP